MAAIARGDYLQRPESGIRGTGYVIKSLEAALWSVARSHDFRDAVRFAANLIADDAYPYTFPSGIKFERLSHAM